MVQKIITMKIKLLIAILLFSLSVTAQYTASEKADQSKYSSLATATDIVSQMAFWSDSTITSGQLIDKSGNGRHATITRNLITDSSAEYGGTLVSWNAGTIANSTEQAHTGTRSHKFSMTGQAALRGARYQSFRTLTGEIINWSIWVYKTAGTSFILEVIRGNATTASSTSVSPALNTWVNYTGSYTETGGGGLGEIRIYYTSGDLTVYMDDLSISIGGKPGIGCMMADNSTLKAIDAGNPVVANRYQFYSSYGAPKVFRADIGSPGFFNKQIFTGGSLKFIFLNAEPDPKTYYWINHLFVDQDYFFNCAEVVKTVKADGTGNYLNIPAALAALNTVSFSDTIYPRIDNRVVLKIYNSVTLSTLADYATTVSPYKVYFNVLRDHIYFDGIGDSITIAGTLPDSSSDASANLCSIVDINATTGFRNLTFTKKNGRYTFHIDGVNDNRNILFYKCIIRNLGVQGIVDYRLANSQPATLVAGGVQAFGCGLKDYEFFEMKNCEVSGINPFFIHSGASTIGLGRMIFYKSKLISQPLYHPTSNPSSELKPAIKFTSLAYGLPHFSYLLNCSFNSEVLADAQYGTALYDLKDWIISIYKYSPFFTSNFNPVSSTSGSLRITGTSGAVVITGGTAQSVLMPSPDYSGNVATGRLEVGEWPTNINAKMGVRLGDCSGVNKTLTMTINGVAKTITFNQNFTAQSNATILSFINTALAGSGTATLYQRANEYLPTIIY